LTQSVYDFKREFGALLTESIHLVRFGDHGVAGCDISFRHDCSVVTRREIDCVKLVSANLAGVRGLLVLSKTNKGFDRTAAKSSVTVCKIPIKQTVSMGQIRTGGSLQQVGFHRKSNEE
jgi:hypothetical protein